MTRARPSRWAGEANQYLRKHQLFGRRIDAPPAADLGLTVVIPCYDEPELVPTLASLWACSRPVASVEVIVVLNASTVDPTSVQVRNRDLLARSKQWVALHRDARLAFHLLHFPELPERHAGVGLARKLGMDEAVRRFADVGNRSGIIVGLDADCRCAPNYLQSIEAHFEQHPDSPACSIYFEHPIEDASEHKQRAGIVQYELFLRYYVQALRYSGFPHAFHTVGSSMAVRADAYARGGGMNRRKAGEDFYFLHKLIPLGGFSEIRDTVVYPSPRISHRVPFGTGRAMGDWAAGRHDAYPAYAPEIFRDLKAFIAMVDSLFRAVPDTCLTAMPPAVSEYLVHNHFAKHLREIQGNAASLPAFRKRFFRWFNGFRALKYVHWASDNHYSRLSVAEAASTLLRGCHLLEERGENESDAVSLLMRYRRMDRGDLLNLAPAP